MKSFGNNLQLNSIEYDEYVLLKVPKRPFRLTFYRLAWIKYTPDARITGCSWRLDNRFFSLRHRQNFLNRPVYTRRCAITNKRSRKAYDNETRFIYIWRLRARLLTTSSVAAAPCDQSCYPLLIGAVRLSFASPVGSWWRFHGNFAATEPGHSPSTFRPDTGFARKIKHIFAELPFLTTRLHYTCRNLLQSLVYHWYYPSTVNFESKKFFKGHSKKPK